MFGKSSNRLLMLDSYSAVKDIPSCQKYGIVSVLGYIGLRIINDL